MKTNPNISPNQQGALNNLTSGADLSYDDRIALTSMQTDPNVGSDVRDVISQGLREDEAYKRRTYKPLYRRYLDVRNETDEPLTIYVQSYTYNRDSKDWEWLPGDPKTSTKALSFRVEPGATVSPRVDDRQLSGNRVRLWGASPGGNRWLDWKDRDLWLVKEQDDEGTHCYYAAKTETFTYYFNP
jgi:hypothetical protein